MAKSAKAKGKNRIINGGIVKLIIVLERLKKKSLLLGKKFSSIRLPEKVKEGHFAVIAHADNDELKRFIVPLSYLTHPSFQRLLEQAAEEYGFDHEGALTVPCRPSELERMLAERSVENRDPGVAAAGRVSGVDNWGSCYKTPVMKSY